MRTVPARTEPSSGGRRWPIAWALAVTQTVGYGVLFYAYGVLTVPMETALGWTRAQTSGAFSLALLTSGLAALAAGRIVDRHGGRGLMTAGSLAGGALVMAWSFVGSLPALYLVQAGIGLVMAAVTYEVAFAVVTRWFRRDRIRALLVVTMLGGFASTIFVPLATVLVETLGWRAALRVLAVVLWTVTVPLHALVLRRAPDPGFEREGSEHERSEHEGDEHEGDEHEGDEHEGGTRDTGAPSAADVEARDAWRDATFWWLTAGFALDRMAIVAIGAHAVPLLLERGHPPGLVAAMAGSIGLLQVAGRLLFAPATAGVSLARLAVVTYLVRAAGLAALLIVPGATGAWAFAGLFGLANGAGTLARAGLVAETYGARNFGTISGSMTTLIALAQTGAPLAVGALRAASGGYGVGLALLTLFSVGAAAAVQQARRSASPRVATG